MCKLVLKKRGKGGDRPTALTPTVPLEATALSQKKKALIGIPHSLLEGQALAVPTSERQGARIFFLLFLINSWGLVRSCLGLQLAGLSQIRP